MHTKRIIPCLDVNNGRVVKGVNFVNLIDAGDPVAVAAAYDKAGAASYLMENATILEKEYREDGIYLYANCYSQDAYRYAIFRKR